MAASVSKPDYFGSPPARRGPPSSTLAAAAGGSPALQSPRTPQLGRSISSQYGSPGTFRPEQDDVVIYELGARHFSAGYAGESKPRCILPFTPDGSRRREDYRQYDMEYVRETRRFRVQQPWAEGHELYRTDLRDSDLGLVEDKLSRALRHAIVDHVQIDAKQRRAVLVIPSMLPTALLEIALRVLFTHSAQPPTISVLTTPIMSCVSAGLRNAIVVDIGWEETVVTAIGEYKEVAQRRSIRAGRLLTREMGDTLEIAARGHSDEDTEFKITFDEAEDVVRRLAWCQQREPSDEGAKLLQLPLHGTEPPTTYSVPFGQLAVPAEKVLLAPGTTANDHDDEDWPVPLLTYRVLLSLPADLRAICVSRIIFTGGVSKMPGLKRRLLQEVSHLIETRGWNRVSSYGSAKTRREQALKGRSANSNLRPKKSDDFVPPLSPIKMPLQEAVAPAHRVHDDIKDPVTAKAEREASKGKVVMIKGVVRGVESLGPWAGASLMASMRVKGAHEVDREDYLKHGLRNGLRDV
ncbi:hypothetical protein DOTSEDRAFT_70217 [Dothistroma septosporum NZE10]|uniref:Actin-like ATPase domain-containing protein n=1 Tax=Dothistroma septosporum (strain NZE10 / CBS 128990) TaxID=675120 RepID=N1PRZ4_DOTSN|nr:hypothetical protein DOTSEDRAFT_70217 [Dothistroma septosporum NZE10]